MGTDDASRAFSNLHKSSKPSARASGIMLEWDMRQRLLGQKPDNEIQLNPSMFPLHSLTRVLGCSASVRLDIQSSVENFMRKTTYASTGSNLHAVRSAVSARKPPHAWTFPVENEKQSQFSTQSLKVMSLADDRTQEQFWDSAQKGHSSLQTRPTTRGTISHSVNEAELRAASSGSSTLHDDETSIRP